MYRNNNEYNYLFQVLVIHIDVICKNPPPHKYSLTSVNISFYLFTFTFPRYIFNEIKDQGGKGWQIPVFKEIFR